MGELPINVRPVYDIDPEDDPGIGGVPQQQEDPLAKLRQLYRDYDRETDTYKGNVLRARIWDEGRRLVGR